jgi:hypothetical protein
MTNRCCRAAPLISWLVVLLAATSASAARAEESLCTGIAGLIRAGTFDDEWQLIKSDQGAASHKNISNLQRLSTGHSESFFARQNPAPEFLTHLKERWENFDQDFRWASTAWLDEGIGALVGGFGHVGVTEMAFFDKRRGQAKELAPPPGLFDERYCCAPRETRVVRIGDVPAIMSRSGVDVPGEQAIAVFPWRAGAWRGSCHVRIEYERTVAPSDDQADPISCREGIDCSALKEPVTAIARQWAKNQTGAGPLDALPQHLQSLVQNTPDLTALPTFDKPNPYVLQPGSFTKIVWNGITALVVLSENRGTYYDNIQAGVWEEANDRLIAVAGFGFDVRNGRLLSTEVGDGPQ